MTDTPDSPAGDRLAKIIARAGLCSRRDAEDWIRDGRVSVNGKVVKTPAFNVTAEDKVKVDGEPLAARSGTRVWLYHKPAGLVVTEKDPEGRPTIFEALEEHGLPRVVTIGRLDINTEGLLLLTNDGGLKRVLELPATGWLRRYRVRAFGSVTQEQLNQLKDGIEVEGVKYGPIEAILERQQGSNVWLVLGLREGKNREVKNVLAALGLQVNRLIRISYGPFQLGDIPEGAVETVKARVLREQLGRRLAEESGADFDSEMPEQATATDRRRAANPKLRAAAPGKPQPRQRKSVEQATAPFRFVDRDGPAPDELPRQRPDRPGSARPQRRAAAPAPVRAEAPLRTVHHEDGSTSQVRIKSDRPRPGREDRPFRDGPRDERPGPRGGAGGKPRFGDKPRFEGKPRGEGRPSGEGRKSFGDKPAFGEKPRFGDKPKFGSKPRFGDKPGFGDKPRSGGKPRFEGKPGGQRPDRGDRPARAGASEGFERKPRRDYGDSPRPPRSGAGRPPAGKPRAPRPAGGKPVGDRPRGPRKPKA